MNTPVDPKEFHAALLVIAVGGLLLLFPREWPVKIAGVFLLLARLSLGNMTSGEWTVLVVLAPVAVLLFWVPRRLPPLTVPPDRRAESSAPAGGAQSGDPPPARG